MSPNSPPLYETPSGSRKIHIGGVWDYTAWRWLSALSLIHSLVPQYRVDWQRARQRADESPIAIAGQLGWMVVNVVNNSNPLAANTRLNPFLCTLLIPSILSQTVAFFYKISLITEQLKRPLRLMVPMFSHFSETTFHRPSVQHICWDSA